MSKNAFKIGILTVILYFLSVGAFLITQSDAALTVWELMTVIIPFKQRYMPKGNAGVYVMCVH